MKKGEKARISSAWWAKGKARTLKSTGLEAALKSCEAALEKAKTDTCGIPDIMAAVTSLTSLDTAVRKTVGMCDKKRHAETLAALQTFKPLIEKEKKLLTTKMNRINKELELLSAASKKAVTAMTAANRSIFLITQGLNNEAKIAEDRSSASKDQIEIWKELAKDGLKRATDHASDADKAWKEYGRIGNGLSRNLYLGHSRGVMAVQRPTQKARSDVERTFPDAKAAVKRLLTAIKTVQPT